MDSHNAHPTSEGLAADPLVKNLSKQNIHKYASMASAARYADPHTRDEAISRFLWEESGPYELKRMLAANYPLLETVRLWNWRYMRGTAFRVWIDREPLDEAAFDNVILNPALMLKDMKSVFRDKKGRMQRSPDDTYSFQDGLTKRSLDEKLAPKELLALLPMFDALEMATADLLTRLRATFNIASDVPDEWVRRIFDDRL